MEKLLAKWVPDLNVLTFTFCLAFLVAWLLAVFQTEKFHLVAQKGKENLPPYIIYYNFYLPKAKFYWSSLVLGRQGCLVDH